MAKLPAGKAQEAKEKGENWEFGQVVPPGVYLCRLDSVDATKSGQAGPYWEWTCECVGAGQEPKGKKFWDNTSLSEKAIGRLGKVFEAFGVPTDTDTDDLIGKLVALEVTQGTNRDGKPKNDVYAWHPADVHALYEEYLEQNGAAAPSADDY